MNTGASIGIDARFFGEAGPGRYVKNIIEHLEKIDSVNNYTVMLRPKGMDEYWPKSPNFHKLLVTAKWYTWEEQTIFLIQTLLQDLDLFYVPHFNVPILYPGKLVTAIPDIIMHTYSTEKGTTLPKPYFKFKKLVYKKVLAQVLNKSSKVIVPTYDVYNDITENYPQVSKDKFIVAYEGVDPVFITDCSGANTVLDKFKLGEKNYLLYISSMYEHKNVERLIEAFALLVNRYKYQGKLVLVGKKDKFSERIKDFVIEKGLQDKVDMPGMWNYITDAELVCLRKNASLYVFPSLKEGFSLTPLEAQVAGLPCVISNISCHREVFEDSVLYFDPLSPPDIAEKIDRALRDTDLRETLRSRGFERVKKYDWTNTAKVTLQVFNEVLTKKKGR